MAKALLMLSGGLDSTLAGKLLLELGVLVEAVNFTSPFCRCTAKGLGCSAAEKAAKQLGITVQYFPAGDDYLEMIKKPRFGRGRGVNPCLDCRIYMLSRAREYLEKIGADFIATGEVLGERPMSQHRQAMATIEREAGLSGRIVRPLCAKLLPPSLPEKTGLVDRERLLSISGRSRSPQLTLAAELGVKDYPCPAGGCLLTDPEFAARMRDLMKYEPDFNLRDVRLLRVGRHFRLPSGRKVIVGRDRAENAILENLQGTTDLLLQPVSIPGPSALLYASANHEEMLTAARMVAAYTEGGTAVRVFVKSLEGGGWQIGEVQPLARAKCDAWRITSIKKCGGQQNRFETGGDNT